MNEVDMGCVKVMHVTDTLDVGGKERVAVNIVNLLPRQRYKTYLCTTRHDGPLASLVKQDVGRLNLKRRHRFDWSAVRSLLEYVRRKQIHILHAHGSSIFIAAIVSAFPPYPSLVWHDHWGRHELERRPVWLYRPAVRRAQAVIAVSQGLARWSREKLQVPDGRVYFIPNFVCDLHPNGKAPDLPGKPGARIVCVANFRPQKDFVTLIRALRIVRREFPAAHLLLVGDQSDKTYVELIRKAVADENLNQNVSFLGQRNDVAAILRGCDIGVLSSASEGLPLSLIEYGLAGLPSVATRVGECAEVLDNGRAGILVSPGAADQLAQAIIGLLRSPDQRSLFSESILEHVKTNYDAASSMNQICRLYETLQPGR
jgi:glycosyltransferase involved in cell wall biosynthesis